MNRRQKTLWARKYLGLVDKITLKYTRRLITEFRRFWTVAADKYDGGLFEISDDLNVSHAANMINILDDLVNETGSAFAVFTMPKKIPPLADDAFGNSVINTLRAQSAVAAAEMTTTTVDRARKIVADQIALAKTPDQIRDELTRQISISKARAATIARTETHNASNQVTYDRAERATEVSGMSVTLEWISTNDGRVRDSHRRADGQKVKLGETFTVGGKKMRRPSDPSGGAENVINCRCVLGFEVE